jgi:hypothetical protein
MHDNSHNLNQGDLPLIASALQKGDVARKIKQSGTDIAF